MRRDMPNPVPLNFLCFEDEDDLVADLATLGRNTGPDLQESTDSLSHIPSMGINSPQVLTGVFHEAGSKAEQTVKKKL
jgi:hypothetical protein